MPVFMLGIAAFQNRTKRPFTEWPTLALWIALSIAAVACGLIAVKSSGFIVIVIALYAVFVAVERLPPTISQFIPKAARLLGQRSYGIYLTHFLIISGLGSIMGRSSSGLIQFAAAFAFTLLASYVIATRIEDAVNVAVAPIRRMLIDNRHFSSRSERAADASPYYSHAPIQSSAGPNQ